MIEIRLDGVDITPDVIVSTAEFNALANAHPGVCRFEVSDRFDTMSFHPGQTLTLDIDGVRAWTGWALTLRRAYHAAVWPTRLMCEGLALTPRVFVIEGVDKNILFSRRFAYDHDDPTRIDLGSMSSSTTDREAIQAVVPYFDLEGIDTSTKVDTVGTIGIFGDLRADIAAASWSFGETMATIAAVSSAVFYIDPDDYLVYADVDGVSTPDVYTDRPRIGGDPPTVVGTRSTSSAGGVTSMLITAPTGWAPGDTFVLVITGDALGSSAPNADVPDAGWTRVIHERGDNDSFTSVYTGPAESPVYVDISSTGFELSFFLIALRNASTPIVAASTTNIATTSHVTPVASGNGLGLAIFGHAYAADQVSTPSGWSLLGSITSPSWTAIRVFTKDVAGSASSQGSTVSSRTTNGITLIVPGQPTHDVGVRSLEILHDGSKLDNDHLTWGTAAGVDHYVFARVQDSASQAAHGRWQDGDIATLYHQAYVNARASSFVYGSPQSKRGGKDDRVSVKFTVFNHPIRVADRPTVESQVFGWSDVIPVRQLRITFPTLDDVKYEVVCSHEIDIPWSYFETPPYRIPDYPIPVIPQIPPVIDQGDVKVGLIIDSFSRDIRPFMGVVGDQYRPLIAGGLGTGELVTWSVNAFGINNLHGVQNGRAVLRAMHPYVYDSFALFDGDQSYQSSAIPDTYAGATTNRENVLVKFRFGRMRRIYQPLTVHYIGLNIVGIPNLTDPRLATDLDAYGRPDEGSAPGTGAGVTRAPGTLLDQFAAEIVIPGGESESEFDPAGSVWTITTGQSDDSEPWYRDNFAGFKTLYANHGGARPELSPTWRTVQYKNELEYGLHKAPSTFAFSGPDLPGMTYPWRIRTRFQIGNTRIDFVRDNLPTADGEPFAIQVLNINTNTYTTTGGTLAKVLQPDTDYWLRLYRPTGDSKCYLNIWQAGTAENPEGDLTPQVHLISNGQPGTWGYTNGERINLRVGIYPWEMYTWEIDLIALAPPGSKLGGAVVGAAALVCEVAEAVIDPTNPAAEVHIFKVSQPWDHVESVTVDGIIQQFGTTWIEDPALGSGYVYVFPPATGKTVRVCYYPRSFQEVAF